MMVTIEEHDRHIVEYSVPRHAQNKTDYTLEIHQVDDGSYVLTFGTKGERRIEWRGTLESCLSKFADEISTFDNDYLLDAGITI